MIYDAAIIGTGPAGLSAALNLKIHQKNFLWFGTPALSDKINRAEQIMNYPGLPAATGEEMQAAFLRQIEAMDIAVTPVMVNAILPMGTHYALMAATDFYEAKTLILATGVSPASTLTGETDFLGRGVSYCATCDGGLYRGKTIAVVCNNRRFEHEVNYLADLAENVYFFPHYAGATIDRPNVEIVKAKITRIEGDKRVSGLTLGDGSTLPVDGIFCLRDAIIPTTLLPGLAIEDGHITVDRRMQTNLPGCFAAGDCTGRPYQYTKAVGEGNVAAHAVIEYLSAH